MNSLYFVCFYPVSFNYVISLTFYHPCPELSRQAVCCESRGHHSRGFQVRTRVSTSYFFIHMQYIVNLFLCAGHMIFYFLRARRQKQTGDGHATSSSSSSIAFINKKIDACFVLFFIFLYPSHIRTTRPR